MSNASRKITELLREGRKIEAIKLLRETTGVGLKEAKEEVDRLSRRLTREASFPATSRAEPAPPSGSVSKEVLDLAREGQKIQAIKLLREQTGMSLKEAKEKVDEVTGEARGGCMTILLLVTSAAMGVLIAGVGI
jgi:ribosomal protein L7/L12